MTTPIDWTLLKERFIEALVAGNFPACLAVSAALTSADQFGQFHRYIIQPSMNDIGERWERGTLTESQEHRASSLVGRVLSTLNARFIRAIPSKGRIVVSTVANEYHELGAWILADMLEQDGWEICYLGANVPVSVILTAITRYRPHIVALSITMLTNVEAARHIITKIREAHMTPPPAVFVGGFAMNTTPGLWKEIGADAHEEDAESTVACARQIWEELPAVVRS